MKGNIGSNIFNLGRKDRHSIDIVPFIDSGLTIPPFEDFVLSAGLFNLNPVGYSGGQAFENDNEDSPLFLTNSPYLPDYSVVTNSDVLDLFDQSTENNHFVDGTGNPSLILTSPTVVAGAGTAGANGTLTYFRLLNGRYSAVYEGSTKPEVDGVYWDSGLWTIRVGSNVQYISTDDVRFPWLVNTWEEVNGSLPIPTITQGTPQTAIINFDGSDDQLVTTANVFDGGSQQGTVYVYFKDDNAGGTNSLIFRTGSGNSAIVIDVMGGNLRGTAIRATGAVNRKYVELSDSDWHFIAFGFDTTQTTNTNQTIMYVDGVLADALNVSDLLDETLGDEQGYMGLTASSTLPLYGSTLGIAVKNVLDTPAQMEAMRLWVESIPK